MIDIHHTPSYKQNFLSSAPRCFSKGDGQSQSDYESCKVSSFFCQSSAAIRQVLIVCRKFHNLFVLIVGILVLIPNQNLGQVNSNAS